MSNVLQSAYKQFHSTETVLLKVHNDVTLNMDKGKVTVLTLLDLSAAFDTIDHNIIIKRLPVCCGVFGTALSWFSSYLTGRYRRVKRANCLLFTLLHSVWCYSGFVLRPVLYTLYATPLRSAIQTHNLHHHIYTNDTHIYLSLATRKQLAS